MRTVTVDDIMAWRPCEGYPRERVEAIGAGRRFTIVVLARDVPYKGGSNASNE